VSRAIRSSSRADWLRTRRIGASDVAALLGKSPYRTPWDVWMRLTGREKETRQLPQQGRGVRWEPIVLDLYQAETELPARRPPEHTTWTRDDRPYLSATPDAFTLDGGRRGLVEAKTDVHVAEYGEPTVIERWTADCAEIVRPVYALQAYAQLAVVDEAHFVDLAVLLPFYELRVFRLLRDLEVEAQLVDTVHDWYAKHVAGDEAPEIDGSDACRGYLHDAFPRRAELRDASDNERLLAERIAALDEAIDEAKDERKRVAAVLQESIGDAYGITLGPKGKHQPKALVIRSKGQSTLDKDALLEARPDLGSVLEQHTRQGDPYAYLRLYNVRPSAPTTPE
jgi:putative phage-type endonuclease